MSEIRGWSPSQAGGSGDNLVGGSLAWVRLATTAPGKGARPSLGRTEGRLKGPVAATPGQVWLALTCRSPWPPPQARKEGFLVWGWFPSTHNAFQPGLAPPGPETTAVGGGGGGSPGRRHCPSPQGLIYLRLRWACRVCQGLGRDCYTQTPTKHCWPPSPARAA